MMRMVKINVETNQGFSQGTEMSGGIHVNNISFICRSLFFAPVYQHVLPSSVLLCNAKRPTQNKGILHQCSPKRSQVILFSIAARKSLPMTTNLN